MWYHRFISTSTINFLYAIMFTSDNVDGSYVQYNWGVHCEYEFVGEVLRVKADWYIDNYSYLETKKLLDTCDWMGKHLKLKLLV